jgi:DNA-3-methyladenine glycosylase
MNTAWRPLPRSFYEPSATQVAPALLGHFLFRRTEASLSGGLIVEVEAYLVDDPASHGFARETRRNQAMYGPPGHAYVYFIYGTHFCFNAVCRPAGVAEAVLVRAIQPLFGLGWMRERRKVKDLLQLASGPGKVCAALAIGREHDRLDLCDAGSPVFIAANPAVAARRSALGPVVTSRRIGLSKAADRPLRFYFRGSHYVSGRCRRE